jgi:hypothetical protein
MTTFFSSLFSKFMQKETASICKHPSLGQLGLMELPPSYIFLLLVVGLLWRQNASCRGCLLLYTVSYLYQKYKLYRSPNQTKKSPSPLTPFSIQTSLLYYLWGREGGGMSICR